MNMKRIFPFKILLSQGASYKSILVVIGCILTFLSFFVLSCSYENSECLFKNYDVESVLIKKDAITQLENGNYNIKIETHLSLPDSTYSIICERMKYENGYYFLQGNGKNQTIWVFDSIGNYISKLGERGRKENEYQTDITDWFFDKNKEFVLVFEKHARKIHKFTLEGRAIGAKIMESWPNAVGAMEDNRIYCSYYHKLAKSGFQLALLSEDEDLIKPFIHLQNNMRFVPTDKCFSVSHGKLFYIPSFADSAIVFNKDSVEKVVRFIFEDKFITEDIKLEAYNNKLDNYHHFDGIQYINTYYETTRFKYLVYVYAGLFINHLIDNATGRQYKFVNSLTAGLFPSNVLYVKGNKLFYLVTRQHVEELRHLLDSSVFNDALSKSDDIIKKIFNGEEPLPLILSIEIKE